MSACRAHREVVFWRQSKTPLISLAEGPNALCSPFAEVANQKEGTTMMAMRSLRGLARRASTATAPSATLSPVIARHALLREDSDCDVAAFDELLRREAHAVSLAD